MNKSVKQHWDRYRDGYGLGFLPDKLDDEKSYCLEEKCFSQIINKKIINIIKNTNISCRAFYKAVWGIALKTFNNVDEVLYYEQERSSRLNLVKLDIHDNTSIKALLTNVNASENDVICENVSDYEDIIQLRKIPRCGSVFCFYDNGKEEFENDYSCFVDITIYFIKHFNEFSFYIKYDSSKYSEGLIEAIVLSVYKTIEGIISCVNGLIKNMETVSREDIIISNFNITDVLIPADINIVSLIEDRAERMPNNIIITFDKKQIRFKELNEKANQLANVLLKMHISPGDIVPMYTQRSVEMIIGIIGILKAGGAYAPFDSEIGLRKMIKEYSPKTVIIYNNEFKYVLDVPVIKISQDELAKQPKENLKIKVQNEELACCIYTSGSSGTPKGVLITHIGLLNAVLTNIKVYSLTNKDTILQFSNYSYAQSIIEIFTSLICAKMCILTEKEQKNIMDIVRICKENKVTIMAMTPSMISELQPEHFETLRILDCTGEVAEVNVLKKWFTYCDVFNSYGVTELTGNTSVYRLSGNEKRIVPIGKPIHNNKYYILDKNYRLCGVGMLGELYIEGLGLARGYLNDPEMTRCKFVINPITGERAFRTGDIARWLPDGNIEYFGRVDEQIKLRGIRINLEEIKKTMISLGNINKCYLKDKFDCQGDKVICAYLMSEKVLDISKIREKLLMLLPLHMVPAYIIQIDKIPLNAHGKIDWDALPNPRYNNMTKYVAATTETEKLLLKVIGEETKIENISVANTFIELGGDSIKAIRVLSKLVDLGYELPVSSLLQKDNLGIVAKKMRKADFLNKNIDVEHDSKYDLEIIKEIYHLS